VWAFALLGSVAVFHRLQMRFLVKSRFDDDGVTVVRVLRRRRFAWADIAGLVYGEGGSSTANSPSTYELRLVPRGQEPPLGKLLTQVQRQDHCGSPVLMAPATLDDDGETKGDHRRRLVLEELAAHGFPPPAPRPWEFRTPRFSACSLTAAVAMDLRGTHAVAVRHGGGATAEEQRLPARTLPELARAHGGGDTTLSEPDFTSCFFEGAGAAEHAAAFLAEARAAVAAGWPVTAGTLPSAEESNGGPIPAGAAPAGAAFAGTAPAGPNPAGAAPAGAASAETPPAETPPTRTEFARTEPARTEPPGTAAAGTGGPVPAPPPAHAGSGSELDVR
jgi:hypothetical protein